MERTLVRQNDKLLQVSLVLGLLTVVFFLAFFMAVWLPPPTDWTLAYRPACLRVLAGKSPYAAVGTSGFFNPIWALIPLLPIAMLPEVAGEAVLIFCTLAAFGYVAYSLGGSPLGVGITLVSYPVLYCLMSGQIDWIVALGFILPPQWGLVFVLTKPQVGAGIALYWAWEAWRKGGIGEVVHLITPAAIGLVLSAVVFLLDPNPGILWQGHHNLSLWPYSIPVGIALLGVALYKHSPAYSVPASLCLSPYFMPHSLAGPLLLGAKSKWVAVLLTLASWGLALVLYYQG